MFVISSEVANSVANQLGLAVRQIPDRLSHAGKKIAGDLEGRKQ
jgi:hypothetical protein